MLRFKRLPAVGDALEGVSGDELGIDAVILGAQVEGAAVVFDEGGVDDADVVAGLVEEGGESAAVTACFLQTEVKALAGADAVKPEEEFGMAGGIGREDSGLGAGLGIGQIAGVEVGFGDINPDSPGGAGKAGFGGDERPGGRFDLGAAWHGFGEVEGWRRKSWPDPFGPILV